MKFSSFHYITWFLLVVGKKKKKKKRKEKKKKKKIAISIHLLEIVCSPRWLLKQEVPKIVKSINRQLREKSIKTKVKKLLVELLDLVCSVVTFIL